MGGIMKLLSKEKVVEYLIIILVTMMFVKVGWVITEFSFLNKKDIDYRKPSDVKSLYYRTKFASQKVEKKVKEVSRIKSDTIKSIKLLAIYSSLDITVITVSKNGKTKVMSLGDEIDGYILEGATSTEALFIRDEKNYSISLNNNVSEDGKSSIKYVTIKADKSKREESDKDIYRSEGITTIKKDIITKYTQNMGDIWKNIGINEKIVNGNIIGFQVNFVKRGSDFAKLGLRRGDIITAINGNALNNYKQAIEVYQNVDSMENLTLRIKRKNEEMELEYEIK